MKKYLFFGYSPLHAHILDNCSEIYCKNPHVLKPKTLKLDRNYSVTNLPDITQKKPFLSKLKIILSLLSYIIKLDCDVLITCNEMSPVSILVTLLKNPSEVWVVDEGNIKINFFKESTLKRYLWREKIKFLITFGIAKPRYRNAKIRRIYTYDDDFVKNYIFNDFGRKSVKVYDLRKLDTTHSTIDNRVLILTSPLTENENGKYPGQELDVLAQLITENKSLKFVIKPHYREDYNIKYHELVSNFDNVELLDLGSLEKPVQQMNIKYDAVIGFHSTALSHFVGVTKVFTLSSLVGSKHSVMALKGLSEEIIRMENLNLLRLIHDT